MSSFWKKIRHRLEVAALEISIALVPRLPRAGVLALSRVLGELAFELDVQGRRVALANLEAAFGDRFLPGERMEIARRSIQNFARTFLDLFWAQNLTPENYATLIDLRGYEQIREFQRQGRGVLMMAHHFGNFEVQALCTGFAGTTARGIAQDFKNPAITPIFSRLRSRSGHEVIPRERAMIRFLKELKRGGACGFIVDLTLKLDEPGALIDTFGMKKWVTPLQALLHERTGAPLIPSVCLPLPDGRYEVLFLPALEIPPGTSTQKITQLCWDVFEPYIRERPELWMWAYKHWRYLPRGATGYPFYANPSGRFQKIAASSQTNVPLAKSRKPVHNAAPPPHEKSL